MMPLPVFPGRVGPLAVALRPQGADDLPFMRTLYLSHRWEEMSATGWPEATRRAFLEDQFRLQWLHYSNHYNQADFLVVELDGQPAGRLYLYNAHPTELRIVEIGLMPEWRGHGVGGALLRAVQEYAGQAGKFCSINVEQSNKARHLYERLGFRKISENGPYMLMEWDLPGRTSPDQPV